MNPENHPTESLDADILQCKADILKALQQASRKGDIRRDTAASVNHNAPKGGVSSPFLSDQELSALSAKQDSFTPNKIPSFDELQKTGGRSNTPPAKEPDSVSEGNKTGNLSDIHLNQDIANRLQSEIVLLQQQIALNNTNYQSLLSEFNQSRLQVEKAENELSHLRSQLETAQQQHLQATPSQADTLAIEQTRRQIEQLQYEQIELREQHQRERAVQEAKILSQEQLIEQLRLESFNQYEELTTVRSKIETMEQALLAIRRENESLVREKDAALSQMKNVQESCEFQKAELDAVTPLLESLNQDKKDLKAHLDEAALTNQGLQDQLQQQQQDSEDTARQLRLRLAEMEDQIAEYNTQSSNEAANKELLIREQKELLDKTELQRHELENKIAGLQAENDRLLAATQEIHVMHRQLDETQLRLDTISRQMERLKGDHQLVGEENNQLHTLIHLRNQEIERLQKDNKILQEHLAEAESEQSAEIVPEPETPVQTMHPSMNVSVPNQEPEDAGKENRDKEIPAFNLAEQIMAEHRRSISSQRQAPGGKPQSTKQQDAVSRVVGQFIGTPESATEPEPKPSVSEHKAPSTPITPASVMAIPKTPAAIQSVQDEADVFFAEIVRRDILRFLDKKKAAQQPPWARQSM